MKQKILYTVNTNTIFYLLFTLFILIRVLFLNYNSAFNDEAIYIVIGRMGLFASDWWSYGASSWMAGLPYIYPALTSMVYQTGGLIASRLLNVVLSILLIEETLRFTQLLNLFDKKTNYIAGLVATFLVGFSSIGMFVSRLATYDLPSFLLFMFSINSFLRAGKYKNGKYYFLSFLTFFLSFLTKITTIFFIPVLLIFSVLIINRRIKIHKKLAKLYFFIPFAIGMFIYTILIAPNLFAYMETQKGLGLANNYSEITKEIWKTSGLLISVAVPSIFLFITRKKTAQLVSLLFLASVIPISHFVLKRLHTLDKHLFITNIFLSVITAYAVAHVINQYKKPFGLFLKKLYLKNNTISFINQLIILLPALVYILFSYTQLIKLEHQWKNSSDVQKFLSQNVSKDDKVLTENGASITLALYGILPLPQNVVTFDWIDYSGLSGEKAYIQALDDKYFDYIELNDEDHLYDNLKNEIRQRLTGNYSLVYERDGFEVFKKI